LGFVQFIWWFYWDLCSLSHDFIGILGSLSQDFIGICAVYL